MQRRPEGPRLLRLALAFALASAAAAQDVYCADSALHALFRFEEGAGDVIVNSAPQGASNLTLHGGPTWLTPRGLRSNGSAYTSPTSAAATMATMNASDAFTLELWLTPDNDDQADTAILAFATDSAPCSSINLALSQAGTAANVRLLTSASACQSTSVSSVLPELVATHIVLVWDGAAAAHH